MEKLKKGERVRLKSLKLKGTVFYVDPKMLYTAYPIQVELDEPYDDSGQTMYRTDLQDITKLKKKEGKATKAEKPAAASHPYEKGQIVMLMVKTKFGYNPTKAKIIRVTDIEVRAKCTHKSVTKTKNIPLDKFLKQHNRYLEMAEKAKIPKRKSKKKAEEKSFDEEEFVF